MYHSMNIRCCSRQTVIIKIVRFTICIKRPGKTEMNFLFLGHSYEIQDSEGMWKQLEDKIQFINEDPDAVWCDVIDIVRAKTDKK